MMYIMDDVNTFASREIELLPLTGFKGAKGGWILLVQRLRSKGVRIITKAKVVVILADGGLSTSKWRRS